MLKNEKKLIIKKNIPKYLKPNIFINYMELILNKFSTRGNWSLLANNMTVSSFWKIYLDEGNIKLLFLNIAPTLISSGKSAVLILY